MTDFDSSIIIDLDAPLSMPLPVFPTFEPETASLRSLVGEASGRLSLESTLERVRSSMALNLPSLVKLAGVGQEKGKCKALLICGGGPSMGDLAQLKKIRALAKRGAKIWAVNKTHDFLLTKGIVPWAACLLDPMDWVAGYIAKPRSDVIYAVASQCHGDVFAALKNAQLHVWHAGVDDDDGQDHPTPLLQTEFPSADWLVIPGPTTVGLRSIMVGYALGFRVFHLFGLDSSMRVGPDFSTSLHAYSKPKPTDAAEGWVSLRSTQGEHRFYTNAHMARQVLDFEDMVERIAELVRQKTMQPIRITVHGDGMLPELAKCYGWHASQTP